MNDCAESQSRVCKAYIADCYGHIATSLNRCRSAEKYILKSNILDMLDRVKVLVEREAPKEKFKQEESDQNETPKEESNTIEENADE